MGLPTEKCVDGFYFALALSHGTPCPVILFADRRGVGRHLVQRSDMLIWKEQERTSSPSLKIS